MEQDESISFKSLLEFQEAMWLRAKPEEDDPDKEYIEMWTKMGIECGYIDLDTLH